MVKIQRSIYIDEDVWELAKTRIPGSLSCYIQKQLEIVCRLDNEKEKIERELYEKEQELIALRSQLCKLEKEDKLKRESNIDFEKAFSSILRIYDKYNEIGENQIINLARSNEVSEKDLISFCKSNGLNVVKFFEPVKHTKKNNGGFLR